jgi:hypothetical protein
MYTMIVAEVQHTDEHEARDQGTIGDLFGSPELRLDCADASHA